MVMVVIVLTSLSQGQFVMAHLPLQVKTPSQINDIILDGSNLRQNTFILVTKLATSFEQLFFTYSMPGC